MGDHLYQAAGDAQVVEDEEAQGHEAHVRHRRVGHQLLHVLLDHGHQAHVDHGDERQRDHQPGPLVRSVGGDRQRETQETVGAQLEHDGGQHGGTARGRFHVHVGEPGVHGPHRHLDGEGRKEGEENQRLRAAVERQRVPGGDVETAASLVVQVDQGHQQEQRAQQRVEEKLERGVDLVRAAPDADDQVHRDQRGFEKDVKQHAVQRREHADHEAAQDEEGAHVLVDAAGDDFPARDDHDDGDEGGQQHEPERDAVHAQVVVDVETLHPLEPFHKLHGRRAELETRVQGQRDEEAGQRPHEGDPAHDTRLFVTPEDEQQHAESDRHPDGKTQQTHVLVLLSGRAIRPAWARSRNTS